MTHGGDKKITVPSPLLLQIHVGAIECLEHTNNLGNLIIIVILYMFLFSSVNIIDYIATLSFYIDLILQQLASHLENADVLEFFSIIRILRLFKLTRHSSGIHIVAHFTKVFSKITNSFVDFSTTSSIPVKTGS